MRRFSGKWALALLLALGALFMAQGCSDRKEHAPASAAGAVSQADIDKAVALARENVEKIRLNVTVSRETRIEVLGGTPSPLPGLVELKLKVSKEDRTAYRKLLVTPDLGFVILGVALRLGEIPRKRVDLENVDLKDAPARGNASAPVTIVEYSDFQCPYCRAAQEVVDQVLRENEGKVRLVYRHFPLKIHPWAIDAAVLSECARRQKPELFWKLHDFYYAKAKDLKRDNILEATQGVIKNDGLDLDKFNKCYLEREPVPVIKKSLDEGQAIGVRGTPVFLVNDVLLSGRQPAQVLNAVIQEELGRDWSKEPPRTENVEQKGAATSGEGKQVGAEPTPPAGQSPKH